MTKGKEKIVLTAKVDVSKASLYQFHNRLFALSPLVNNLFDISDKLNPMLLSSFCLSGDSNASSNTFLGLTNNKGYFSIGYCGIQVVDFLNENNPVNLGVINDILIGAKWKFLSDNYLITNIKTPVIYQIGLLSSFSIVYKFNHEIVDFILVNNHLICATLIDGIKVYDLSKPSSPCLVFSLNVNAVSLYAKDSKYVLAEGADSNIYFLDVSNVENIAITTKIKIPGPITANSLICKEDILFIRFMRKTVGDTTMAFNLSNIQFPKVIFDFKSQNMPLYTANDKLLVFIGIKDWDGVSPISSYTTSLYRIFSIESDEIRHIGDIELEGIWFSSVTLSENIVYIARPNEIQIYSVNDK